MTRALFLHEPFDARVGPYAPPPARSGEVSVKVAAVGLCGSDLHYYKDGGIGSAKIVEPFVPGHEVSAYVPVDLPQLGLKRGALVAIDPNLACGQCEFCARGHHNLCPNVRFLGSPPVNGAMTEEICVSQSQIVPLPQGFSPLDGVMLEPLGVAIHAVDLARPRLLESVAVVGCGPIGLLTLQLLKLAGVGDRMAVDLLAHRRAAAARLGATWVGGSVEELQAATNGSGCELVIEATNSPNGFQDAALAAKIGGRVVIVGIPDGDQYSLRASDVRRRGLSIKFARRMGDVYPRAIELVDRRLVDVASMVTGRFALDEAPDVFARHANNDPQVIKSLIYPNGP